MGSELEQLAPGFLVASPALGDPSFDHTVVLVCAHNENGAMGLVLNREAPITLGEVMRQLEMKADRENGQAALFGGPVSLESALILYQSESQVVFDSVGERLRAVGDDDELEVSSELRLSPGKRLLERIATGKGPRRIQLFLGHAGWAPGQLEREIARGAWIPVKLDLDLIFKTPADQRWKHALQIGGLVGSQVSGVVSSFWN